MYLYIQPESNYYSTLSNDFTLKYNETPYVRLAKAIFYRKDVIPNQSFTYQYLVIEDSLS